MAIFKRIFPFYCRFVKSDQFEIFFWPKYTASTLESDGVIYFYLTSIFKGLWTVLKLPVRVKMTQKTAYGI